MEASGSIVEARPERFEAILRKPINDGIRGPLVDFCRRVFDQPLVADFPLKTIKEEFHGRQKEIQQKVWRGSKQVRQERDAPKEEGDA